MPATTKPPHTTAIEISDMLIIPPKQAVFTTEGLSKFESRVHEAIGDLRGSVERIDSHIAEMPPGLTKEDLIFDANIIRLQLERVAGYFA